jgi:hypothetical protein
MCLSAKSIPKLYKFGLQIGISLFEVSNMLPIDEKAHSQADVIRIASSEVLR